MRCITCFFVVVFGAAACGPSFQAVYEGDQRFEHCYAVDESPQQTQQAKADCWRDWMKYYTYGQTKDRVEYASGRHYALTSGEDHGAHHDGGARKARNRALTRLVPGSIHEAPPIAMPEPVDAGPPDDARAPEDPTRARVRPPGAQCIEECMSTWNACRAACKEKACEACDKTHGTCVVGCYSDPKKARKDGGR